MNRFPCPFCQKTLRAQDDWSGRDIACPSCGQRFVIPPSRPAPQAEGKLRWLSPASVLGLRALPKVGRPLADKQLENEPVTDGADARPAANLGNNASLPKAVGIGAVIGLSLVIGLAAVAGITTAIVLKHGAREPIARGVETRRAKIDSDLTTWTDQELLAELSKPEVIFRGASPSVVKVVTLDSQGREDGFGSGFVVGPRLIATNYHVLDEGHAAYVVFPDKTKLAVLGVSALDEAADLAIIQVGSDIKSRPLELAGNELPAVATRVYAIGNPEGLDNSYSEGPVSGHPEIRSIKMIQTTAAISQGSSGGPLLGTDGKVVGVTTAFHKRGQSLNFAVPAFHVARLLRQSENSGQLTRLPISSTPVAAAFIKRGNSWKNQKDYDKAIAEFDEAIRIDPKNSYAWALKNDFDRAIRDYDEAIRLDPTDADYRSFRGGAWVDKKNFDKAIDDFQEAIRLEPKNRLANSCLPLAFASRGSAALDRKDYDSAIDDLKEAIRLSPGNEQAHSNLATSYFGRGNAWSRKREYNFAIRDYSEALKCDPKDAAAYFGRGYAWSQLDNYDNAIRDYNSAIRFNPKDAFSYFSRANAWMQKRDFDTAIADFDEALRLDPFLDIAHKGRRLAVSLKSGMR